MTTAHAMGTISHHLLPAFILTGATMMFHLAHAACDEANEQEKTYNDKEPGNKGKEFAGHVFPEFCKQQSACKDSQ